MQFMNALNFAVIEFYLQKNGSLHYRHWHSFYRAMLR